MGLSLFSIHSNVTASRGCHSFENLSFKEPRVVWVVYEQRMKVIFAPYLHGPPDVTNTLAGVPLLEYPIQSLIQGISPIAQAERATD